MRNDLMYVSMYVILLTLRRAASFFERFSSFTHTTLLLVPPLSTGSGSILEAGASSASPGISIGRRAIVVIRTPYIWSYVSVLPYRWKWFSEKLWEWFSENCHLNRSSIETEFKGLDQCNIDNWSICFYRIFFKLQAYSTLKKTKHTKKKSLAIFYAKFVFSKLWTRFYCINFLPNCKRYKERFSRWHPFTFVKFELLS